jgi:Leucine-rich repeat (LRR) protein
MGRVTSISAFVQQPNPQYHIPYSLVFRVTKKEISYLANLQVLILDNNMLNIFPEVVLEMPHLAELSLNDNKIQEIPVGIQKLTNLKMLSIAGNRISGVLPIEVIRGS